MFYSILLSTYLCSQFSSPGKNCLQYDQFRPEIPEINKMSCFFSKCPEILQLWNDWCDNAVFEYVILPYSFHSTWLKIVSSWPTLATNHYNRLMSWRVLQKEHERISETGVFPSLDRVSGTLCLSHYVTEISHLYILRDFWRHFGLCCIVTVAFLRRVQIFLLTYLVTYMFSIITYLIIVTFPVW